MVREDDRALLPEDEGDTQPGALHGRYLVLIEKVCQNGLGTLHLDSLATCRVDSQHGATHVAEVQDQVSPVRGRLHETAVKRGATCQMDGGQRREYEGALGKPTHPSAACSRRRGDE